MACLALYCSGYRGKVVLHWHSDILRQRILGRLYHPLQSWLIDRADVIIGTSPVYIENSEDLARARAKSCCVPIGVLPVPYPAGMVSDIRAAFPGKKIVFSLGRLVEYKGHKTLIKAAEYLDDSYVVVIDGAIPLKLDKTCRGLASTEKERQWMRQMTELVKYMDSDKVWKENIVHIHVQGNGDLVLIPREGQEKFIFGKPTAVAEKFTLMECYYTSIAPARGKDKSTGDKPVIDTHRPVLHNAEWLAETLLGRNWLSIFKAQASRTEGHPGVRVVCMEERKR